MPLNTITITIQQVVHNTQGWDSVQVGEMTDLWLKVRDYFSIESGCIDNSNRVGVFALDCSSATLCSSSTSSYYLLRLSSKEGHVLREP